MPPVRFEEHVKWDPARSRANVSRTTSQWESRSFEVSAMRNEYDYTCTCIYAYMLESSQEVCCLAEEIFVWPSGGDACTFIDDCERYTMVTGPSLCLIRHIPDRYVRTNNQYGFDLLVHQNMEAALIACVPLELCGRNAYTCISEHVKPYRAHNESSTPTRCPKRPCD